MKLKIQLLFAGMGSVLPLTLAQCWQATKLYNGLTTQHRWVWITKYNIVPLEITVGPVPQACSLHFLHAINAISRENFCKEKKQGISTLIISYLINFLITNVLTIIIIIISFIVGRIMMLVHVTALVYRFREGTM